MSARQTALSVLTACRRDGAWVNAALKEALRRDRLDARDAALASFLCYGVTQNRMKLDFYLEQLLTGKRSALHPVALDCLRLGLYQILEMDRIPDSAAVNESVALAKKYCPNPKAAGLVNAVLRAALRQKDSLKAPTGYAEKYSHPDELISLLKKNLPKGALEPMLIADNGMPDTAVQVNTLRVTAREAVSILEAEGVTAKAHPWLPDCLLLSGTGSLEKLPSFQKGLYYVQDPAAHVSVLCAGLPREGARVLDCCAAPGGKSFAAAIAMGGKGQIISCDIYDHKRLLLEKGAQRLGLTNITVRVQDAAQFVPEWENAMDCVIADVPCSGLGIIRKKPDIRYKDLSQIHLLPELQLAILRNQARYVRPGGVLLYSTCTVLRGENEEVAAAFLEENKDFVPEKLEKLPENTTGMFTFIPGQYDTDGFFICKLRRKP